MRFNKFSNMACVQNMIPGNADSEMEEGEIVDDLDDLSDISSEEEFLLRQRLEVLENYNNVLERKKAKISSSEADKKSREDALSHDLSEISDTEIIYTQTETNKCNKTKHSNIHKIKRRKTTEVISLSKSRDHRRKPHKVKKKNAIKINDSSEESEDEYRNKRRKLANAVSVTTEKNDTSSLKARLKKMLCSNQIQEPMKIDHEEIKTERIVDSLNWCIDALGNSDNSDLKKSDLPNEDLDLEAEIYELIDLCEDDEDTKKVNDLQSVDCVDSVCGESKKVNENVNAQEDSDEDLEVLRQHALETKTSKAKSKKINTEIKPTTLSEEEDSDTAELRAICLKSALLKKAIEMKRKQKLRKRLSQSFQDEFILDNNNYANKVDAENNTDIESVDMDIGSDGDEKPKEICINIEKQSEIKNINNLKDESAISKHIGISEQTKDDEIEEDEDLLRAKLLTSLSKNLPNLISPNVLSSINEVQLNTNISLDAKINKTITVPEQKPVIIKLGGSDSEGEHEATKNLTKMHLKWSEQVDFQNKLDLFLKSTRMEVEKKEIPDDIQKPPEPINSTPKFVAKTVKHLPKPEQIEYKNLVKRMEELEKIKKARQSAMNSNRLSIQAKETLKPRNITIESHNINDLEEQIAMSRKKIAEESAKILRLKEEGIKLSQKQKIVATELRNITTAITLNKKEQRLIQNRLSKIRHQHQLLLKSSLPLKHSLNNLRHHNNVNGKNIATTKLQKENNPAKDDYKNQLILKSFKVSVVNDLKDDSFTNSRLSVEVDVSSNNKIVKIPKNAPKDRVFDAPSLNVDVREVKSTEQVVEKDRGSASNNIDAACHEIASSIKGVDDYKSPLESLHADTCVEDPNTFLCPFEIGGTCKDPDCKHLHPKIPSNQ